MKGIHKSSVGTIIMIITIIICIITIIIILL